ncbi:MAG: glycosyltransferase family 87 protein [Thermoguttaceae bacterium]
MFFKFNRLWSVRNLDLIGLILLTPGLLLLAMRDDQSGYAWLFIVGLLILVRLVFDTVMTRRPLLEPNLTPGGMAFSCFFLLCFVVAALTVNRDDRIDTVRTVRLEQILTTRHIDKGIGMNPVSLVIPSAELPNLPPGFRPFWGFVERTNLIFVPPIEIREKIIPTKTSRKVSANFGETPFSIGEKDKTHQSTELVISDVVQGNQQQGTQQKEEIIIIRTPASVVPELELLSEPATVTTLPAPVYPSLPLLLCSISVAGLCYLTIVFCLIYIGHCHFGNMRTGIACATLYLLHPYTNQMIARLDHLMPSALILIALALYRRPLFAGLAIGTAAALVFYPICLVPLWLSFYLRRGGARFIAGIISAIVLFVILLLFSPNEYGTFSAQLMHLLGKSSLRIFSRPDGFWAYYDMIYRVPVFAIFIVACFAMLLWPSHKHLATLISCSAFILLISQLCQVYQGGLYLAWYLPLLILTIFRPNLEDRTAMATVTR